MAVRTGIAASPSPPGAAELARAARELLDPEPWPRRILVGSSGAPSSAPALTLARALARNGASVELLVVHAVPATAIAAADARAVPELPAEGSDRTRVAQLLRAVRAQRDALVRSGPVWPLRFESGDPPLVVTRVARDKDADLIVLGIGHVDPRERQRGDIMAVRTANESGVPVYAAASGTEALSRRTVVLLPDGVIHLPTLRAAIACTHRDGHVWLAAPSPADMIGAHPDLDGLHAVGALSPASRGDSGMPFGHVTVHAAELEGELLTAVLALAASLDAQLVAVPLHRSPAPARSLDKTYAGPLLLTATRSVLVVPDSAAGGEASC